MEQVRTSETSVYFNETTRRYIIFTKFIDYVRDYQLSCSKVLLTGNEL
jgi:hypothetical protein